MSYILWPQKYFLNTKWNSCVPHLIKILKLVMNQISFLSITNTCIRSCFSHSYSMYTNYRSKQPWYRYFTSNLQHSVLVSGSICCNLPALHGGHDTLVIGTLTEGVVVVGHPQVVSQLVRHCAGYLNQRVPGILYQRENGHQRQTTTVVH